MRSFRHGNPLRIGGLTVALISLLAVGAGADYIQDFESLSYGAPVGLPLTGQDGFYIPSGTTSVDYLVYTYLLNEHSIPQNPTGGVVYVAGTGPGDGSTFARGQRDITMTPEVWEFAYDFLCHFEGTTASNNLGSFSAQPGPNDFIHLFAWKAGFEGQLYTAGYMFYDAGGTQFPQPGNIPGTAWDDLVLDNWYRSRMVIDYALNKVMEVAIQDVTGGGSEISFMPTDWYLEGGMTGSTADMTAHRFFAGAGANCCNTVAFDNVSIRVLGATPVDHTTWGGIKAHFK